MTLQFLFSILGTVVGTIGFFPYIRDIFRRKTRPHIYTWLVLTITQGIGTAAIVYGGGMWGGLWLGVNTLLALLVFVLSFRFGSKNITRADTIILVAALCAIAVWLFLDNPYWAVLMASLIDVLAGIPTIRKAFYEPWSETISLWVCFIIGNFFSIAALQEYNFLTLCYLIAINTGNIVLVLVCLIRRDSIKM